MKYYMESKDEDGVFTIDGYKDRIIDGEDEEIELFEMKRDIGGCLLYTSPSPRD